MMELIELQEESKFFYFLLLILLIMRSESLSKIPISKTYLLILLIELDTKQETHLISKILSLQGLNTA
jgi:hypothetical protein